MGILMLGVLLSRTPSCTLYHVKDPAYGLGWLIKCQSNGKSVYPYGFPRSKAKAIRQARRWLRVHKSYAVDFKDLGQRDAKVVSPNAEPSGDKQ